MWIFVDLCGFLWIFVVHKYPQKSTFIATIIHTRLAEVELRTRTTMIKKTTETETEAKSGWVNWRSCPVREVLLQDLEPGGLLHDMDHVGADVLFHFYKLMPQFNDVGFDQFKARLADHRKQSWKKHELASRDEDACAHDRRLLPPEYRDSTVVSSWFRVGFGLVSTPLQTVNAIIKHSRSFLSLSNDASHDPKAELPLTGVGQQDFTGDMAKQSYPTTSSNSTNRPLYSTSCIGNLA